MRFTAILTASVAFLPLSGVIAAPPTMLEVQRHIGEKREGSFIVTFKQGTDKSAWITKRPDVVTHDYDAKFLNGFAGKLDDETLRELRINPDIESVAEDGIMHAMAITSQTGAPWGLARLSQDARLDANAPSFTYRFNSSAGSGSDVYIVDTGIYIPHQDFGGRASWGATFGGYVNADGNGHGTHVAATAVGTRFGVAKAANAIAVKVLSDGGSGSVSDIIAGLNWISQQATMTGRPTIASMSLGGGVSTSLDNAVAALSRAGIHVVVAAGNENQNAANVSPARAPSAITVGAINIADMKLSSSNFGSPVNIFAAGQNIMSAWIGSPTATNTLSGTSTATPHVAGLAAYLASVFGNMSPAAMASLIQSLSVKGGIIGLPSGTVNAIARNDIR